MKHPIIHPIALSLSAILGLMMSLGAQAQTVKLGALVNGQITQLMVKEGDLVQKGQILLEIDARALSAKAGQVKANLRLAELELKDAKVDFEAEKALFDQNATAKRRFDVVQLTNDRAKARVELLKAELAELQALQDYHSIRAPVSGKISQLSVSLGDTVFKEHQPLLQIEVSP